MSSPAQAEVGEELLNDFYAECDEHLKNIREALGLFEQSIAKAQPDLPVLEELYRNFHSFKGISAIVGLRPAEELAHHAEDYLRELSRGRVTLSVTGLESLMAAAQKLEQIVVAFRSKKPWPDFEANICSLKQAAGHEEQQEALPGGSAVASAASGPNVENARSRGLVIWRCLFVPSRDQDALGININTVRSRLAEAGEILSATPNIKGEGKIEFEFLLAARETPADITRWEKEGITVELLDQAQPAPLDSGAGTFSAESAHSPFIAPSHVVRVDLNKLDDLMRIAGEMVIHRSRLEGELIQETTRKARLDADKIQEVNIALARSVRELRQALMKVRLVPVAEIFARMPFVVRDLARETKKQVRLSLEGQQTELDKYLIERLKDPLLHLVRNAFSHGVETPEERVSAGKPAEATILLRASTRGDSVIIQIRDNGRGIDARAIRARAERLGLAIPDPLDSSGLLKLLCAPGFSTRDSADRTSGRGMGMAVVYNTVRELGGSITLESELKGGTQFTLRLPLTLTVSETFIVSSAEQTCAIPQSFVTEVLQIEEREVRTVNRTEVVPYRSGILPIVRLASIFRRSSPNPRSSMLVITSERGSAGLVVDRIHGQREVVVRAIRDPLVQVPGIIGATELGDGRPVLILDGAALTSGAVKPVAPNEAADSEISAFRKEQ